MEWSGNEAMVKEGPEPKRILVVEDDYLIARDLEDQLSGAGFLVVGPASTVFEAMSSMEGALPDFAILDVNLGDETSYAVADALKAGGVRFVFTTGYGPEGIVPRYRSNPVLTKPYTVGEIADIIRQVP